MLAYGSAPTSGSLGTATEIDYYRFSGTIGDDVRVRVARPSSSAADPAIDVRRQNGSPLFCGNSGPGPVVDATCTSLPATETYLIRIQDDGNDGHRRLHHRNRQAQLNSMPRLNL